MKVFKRIDGLVRQNLLIRKNMKNYVIWVLLFVCIVPSTSWAKSVAKNADSVRPLLNGQLIPDVNVTAVSGEQVTFKSILENKKSIVFFYRGGWCPFCNTQLGQLKAIEPQLKLMGFQLIGISTDSLAMLSDSSKDKNLPYTLLSDFNSEISQVFGLAFYTSADTTNRYLKKMKLKNPLQKNAQNEKRLVLPVPAVYVFDKSARVQFNYVNPSFKVRLAPSLLLEAAKLVK